MGIDKDKIDKATKAAINLNDHGEDCGCSTCAIDAHVIEEEQETVSLLSTVFNALFPSN